MTTDRTYLMAGSIATRLNNALPVEATVLEADLDTDREMVHVRIIVGRAELYFGIADNSITSTIEHDGFTSPYKTLEVSGNAYVTEGSWGHLVCDYITSEVKYFSACNTRPRPTGSDLVKSQAESEQGYSLA
jgi:hypothetical protein